MEKEHQPDSMATVQMKPDYPPSEVYSTSEPPPAYRNKPAASIQIARIVAVTIVVSSFVLGAFILASSYVTARAGCQQLDQLDAMLDKELVLESREFQGNLPYYSHDHEASAPVAHALHQDPPQSQPAPQSDSQVNKPEDALQKDTEEESVDENKLQTLMEDKPSQSSSSESDDTSSSQDSGEASPGSDDSDESDDSSDVNIPFNIKLPIQRDLDDVARALLMNSNLRSRMGCVVERHRAEEFGLPAMGPLAVLLGGMDPRRRTTGERIAIICESGDEPSRPAPEPQHPQMVMMPFPGSMRYPGPTAPEFRGMHPAAPQPALQPPPAPQQHQIEQGALPAFVPQEMRIHVQRVIAIPPPHHQQPPQQQQPQQPDEMQMEQIAMPLPLGGLGGLAALGLTPADLRAIQRTVQEAAAARQRQEQQESIDNDMQEVKTIVNTLEAEARAEEEESHEEEQRAQVQAAVQAAQALVHGLEPAQAQAQEQARAQAHAHAMQAQQHAHEMEVLRQEDLAGQEMMGRRAFGRGLPVHIPVPMMVEETQAQQMVQEEGEARPHYVQPRSV